LTENRNSMQAVPGQFSPVPAGVWTAGNHAPPTVPKPAFERPLAAIKRYKWVIVAVVLLATLGGFAATRFVKPQYEVRATIWIEPQSPVADASGPIRSRELLNSSAWLELLRSYRIADSVVRKLALYVKPANAKDFWIFSNFAVSNRFVPGRYELQIDPQQKTWSLATSGARHRETGTMADSVGRSLGFDWVIPATAFSGRAKAKIDFTVSTPRETAVDLMKQLNAELPQNSNFLWLRLKGEDPQLAQRTLNTWIHEYVDVAGELKRRNVVEFANILQGQLRYAETSLRDAEKALEDFRVQTITLPAEGGPVAAGLEMTRDPALKSFFDQKIEYDDIRHDREALEKVINGAKSGTIPWEAALLIPSVAQSPGASALREAFTRLAAQQTDLAAKRQLYTDQHPAVQEITANITTLQTQTIPLLATRLLVQLKQREGEYDTRIRGASRELQEIPTRTIEEMRLRRAVLVSEGLYTTLKSRYAEAQLAAASASPDVSVLDSAIAPLRPTRNTAPTLLLMAILGGLGAAIALAILLDTVDPRIRYPDQVNSELGLSIAGAIPSFPKGRVSSRSPEQLSQLVESIRTVRMHIQNAVPVPVTIAVSSPSPGDGKSFLSANLAMSFSDAGYRTVLVDGDTRRGLLHETFSLTNGAGLTDYLSQAASISDVTRATSHERLSFISRGRRLQRSPELLASSALPVLAAELRNRFDVVVFDTPPLSAGIDAYAIAAAAQNLVLVLRIGRTERRMASAKLALVDCLPVHLVGAVLNCVQLKGEFEYYRYAEGYGIEEEERAALTR
jgi:succinoglycan biosynthesis transport protein ExoP